MEGEDRREGRKERIGGKDGRSGKVGRKGGEDRREGREERIEGKEAFNPPFVTRTYTYMHPHIDKAFGEGRSDIGGKVYMY